MGQSRVPAVFMRGGTSRGIFFRREWLPDRQEAWDPIFLAALGSPDPYGRQLDGLGGGISSLSKVMIIEPSSRPDIDIEYTFGQVAIGEPRVEYRTNCGNLTSAIGPFAVDEGLVAAAGAEAHIRLYNTNTGKRVLAAFPLDDGKAATDGDFEIPGVAGRGAPIRLEFQDPGGAATGRLLPTGRVVDRIPVAGGEVEASIVDATTAVVFVRAETAGIEGTELPEALERNAGLLARLESIRAAAAVLIGAARSLEEASERSRTVPIVAMVAPPKAAVSLTGDRLPAEAMDISARMLSLGRPHRALPLTASMCLAVAARIEGTLVHRVAAPTGATAELRVGHPSGVMPVAATVRKEGDWTADSVIVYRTARRLMEGSVLVPASRLNGRG
jgi:hypothetical protein